MSEVAPNVTEEQKMQSQDDFLNDSVSSVDDLSSCYILEKQKADIVDVWANNFEEEIEKISKLVEKYTVIAMDTEFPGINKIPKIQGRIDEKTFEYQLIRENVKHQKIIQIGISIADEQGNVPDCVSTWQFNFKFDENLDLINSESKSLLKNAGIDFKKFKEEGLDFQYFSELMIPSGILLNDDITWVAFHGGFDFGYYLQMVYGKELPEQSEEFYKILANFFPKIYDLKYIIKESPTLKEMGLQKLSSELEVKRIGPQHQAGSDSLLTLATFFKLKDSYYINSPQNFERGQNIIFGIGPGYCNNKDRDYLQTYKMMIMAESNSGYNSEISDMHYPNMQPYVMYDQNYLNAPTFIQPNGGQQHPFMPNWNQIQQYQYNHIINDNDQLQQQQKQLRNTKKGYQ